MLNFLSIENIVLIQKADINFDPGFNVLSGETGSGKSILLDSLGLAIGFRSNIRLIKQGEKQSKVVAEFDISKNKSCQKFLSDNNLENEEENPFKANGVVNIHLAAGVTYFFTERTSFLVTPSFRRSINSITKEEARFTEKLQYMGISFGTSVKF